MSSFECWSLLVSSVGVVAACVTAGAAIWAVLVAMGQFKSMTDSFRTASEALRVNGLLAILQIESELNRRKESMDEAVAAFTSESAKKNSTAATQGVVKHKHDTSIENYLNCLDRLAHCFLKEYVPPEEWRLEYRVYINEAVKTHSECFQPGTPYTNILELNEKWQSI